MPDFPEPSPIYPLYYIKREYNTLEVKWAPILDTVAEVHIQRASGMGGGLGIVLGYRHRLFTELVANADYQVIITECTEDGCVTVPTQKIYTRPPHLPLHIARLMSDPTESGVRVYWLINQPELEPVEYDDRLRLQLGKLHKTEQGEFDYLTKLEFGVGKNSHFFDVTTDLRDTYALRCTAWVDLWGERDFKNESRWGPQRGISLAGYASRVFRELDLELNSPL